MTSRRDFLWLAAAGGLAASVHAAGARHTIAQTRAGKIAGVRERGVHIFKGVPYGADTAARRFLPPVATTAWKRVRDAHEYGPACPQLDAKEPASEDCLSLNVWTPASPGRRRGEEHVGRRVPRIHPTILRDHVVGIEVDMQRAQQRSLDGGRYAAMHTMDVPLVFDNIAQPGSLTGTDAAAQKVADRMSDAFVAFARSGDPNHTGLPQWRPYDMSSRATTLFDAECKLADDPRGGERRLFAQVPYIQRGTY